MSAVVAATVRDDRILIPLGQGQTRTARQIVLEHGPALAEELRSLALAAREWAYAFGQDHVASNAEGWRAAMRLGLEALADRMARVYENNPACPWNICVRESDGQAMESYGNSADGFTFLPATIRQARSLLAAGDEEAAEAVLNVASLALDGMRASHAAALATVVAKAAA